MPELGNEDQRTSHSLRMRYGFSIGNTLVLNSTTSLLNSKRRKILSRTISK